MKRFIYIIITSLLGFSAFSQPTFNGPMKWKMQSWRHWWAGGVANTDSVAAFDSARVKFFKPVVFAHYTTANIPPASLFTGAIIYNTDSNFHQYSNGSSWNNVPGAGGGGGGGTPGGSDTEIQYNNGGVFAGATGYNWSSTNSQVTLTKSGMGAVPNLTSGIMLTTSDAASLGNTKVSSPLILRGYGWSTTGGVSIPIDYVFWNSPVQGTTASGSLNIGVAINGGSISSLFTMSSSGQAVFSNNLSTTGNLIAVASGGRYSFTSRSGFTSPSNGIIRATDNATTGFLGFQFGPASTSFPYLKVNGGGLQIRLGDDSGFGTLGTGTLQTNSTVTMNGLNTAASPTYVVTKQADSSLSEITSANLRTLLQLETGTYTPTVLGSSGMTSPSALISSYERNGNKVTVYGRYTMSTMTGTTGSISLSLPIASNLGSNDVWGGAGSTTGATSSAIYSVSGDAVNDGIFISVNLAITEGYTVWFIAHYTII